MKLNNKIKTIIIEDETHWQFIIKKLINNIPELSLENTFSDVETAYDFLQDHEVELIYLDMQIKDDQGIDLIKRLEKEYTVVIISSHTDYALAGYSISAIDFVTKPIDFERFEKATQKAIQHIRLRENAKNERRISHFDKDYFLIKDDQAVLKINYKDVIYITALENYIKIITPQKSYMVLTTLVQFERSINDHPFLRVHRSHIVNLNCINMLTKDMCVLTNNHEVPISDFYRNEVQEVFVEGKVIKR